MDAVDGKILKILSENAAATATEIGEAVNLSIPAINKRILKLSLDQPYVAMCRQNHQQSYRFWIHQFLHQTNCHLVSLWRP